MNVLTSLEAMVTIMYKWMFLLFSGTCTLLYLFVIMMQSSLTEHCIRLCFKFSKIVLEMHKILVQAFGNITLGQIKTN